MVRIGEGPGEKTDCLLVISLLHFKQGFFSQGITILSADLSFAAFPGMEGMLRQAGKGFLVLAGVV